MQVFYSPRYTIPLPEGHRFPMGKYRLLHDKLLAEGVLDESEIHEPPLASLEQVRLAHTAKYVDGMSDGTVDPHILRRIGFPWSEGLVLRSLSTVGGCLAAAERALDDGIAGNLAGGTHHAKADAGEGFCVFNDIAVALLSLRARGRIR